MISTFGLRDDLIGWNIVVVEGWRMMDFRVIDQVNFVDGVYFGVRIVFEMIFLLLPFLPIFNLFCFCLRYHFLSRNIIIMMQRAFMNWTVVDKVEIIFGVDFWMRVKLKMLNFLFMMVRFFVTVYMILYLSLSRFVLGPDFMNIDTEKLRSVLNFLVSKRFVKLKLASDVNKDKVFRITPEAFC